MKRIFNIGKIDYMGTGRKNCTVTVEMELKQKEDGRETLSICGNIWDIKHTDILCGGQCLDTIAQYVKTPLFRELFHFWKEYHLNDMHTECEHQAAQGWKKIAAEKVTFWEYVLTVDAIREQRKIKSRVLTAAKTGETYTTKLSEQLILSLEYSVKSPAEQLPENIAGFYKLKGTDTKLKGWCYETEHPEGILCKPCPVCGYKYGSSWKYFPIPADDLNRIKQLLKEGV